MCFGAGNKYRTDPLPGPAVVSRVTGRHHPDDIIRMTSSGRHHPDHVITERTLPGEAAFPGARPPRATFVSRASASVSEPGFGQCPSARGIGIDTGTREPYNAAA
jgi:hypothetical protein